jgi:hypothetical protein
MPRMGFEPTIPVFKWAKIVYALDSTATVISSKYNNLSKTHTLYWLGYQIQFDNGIKVNKNLFLKGNDKGVQPVWTQYIPSL